MTKQKKPTETVINMTDVEKPKKSFKKKLIIWIVLFFVVWILLALRPYFHEYILEAWKYKGLVIIILAMIIATFKVIKSKTTSTKWKIATIVVCIGLPSIFLIPAVREFAHQMYMQHIFNTMDKKEIDELPLTRNERIHPENNILTMAYERVQGNYDISKPHLVHDYSVDSVDNVWSFYVQPSAKEGWQRVFGDVNEMYTVLSHKSNPDMAEHRIPVKFNYGESMVIDKDIKNATIKALGLKYFNTEPDEVFAMHNDVGEPVLVVSLIKWTGFVFAVPKFGGVMVFNNGPRSFGRVLTRTVIGDGTYIAPDDIKNYKYLHGQNLLSEKVARVYAEAFEYLEGYEKGKISRENAIEIPDMDKDQNEYPFTVDFNWSGTKTGARNGKYLYIGLEPIGTKRKSLVVSVFIPADGMGTVYYINHAKRNDGLAGVTSMSTKVIEELDDKDWLHRAPVEFRPYIPNIPELSGMKKFFWLTTIVALSQDSTKHFGGSVAPDLVLINARDGEVIEVNSKKPDTWANSVRERYGIPIQKDSIILSKPLVTLPLTDSLPKPDTVHNKVYVSDTVRIPVQIPDTIQKKKDTIPVVKQQPIKTKSKTKKRKGSNN
jgi:hypothetical protein